MPRTPEEFERELRDLLEELRPYALAYYQPLVTGEIETREQLAAWARDFYVRDVGTVLARVYARCPHLDVRRFIAENLYEEEGRFQPGRSHVELSRRVARHFGLTDEQIEERWRARKSAPEAAARRASRPAEGWLEEFAGFGLGAEYFAPALFQRIIPRLRDHFGLPDETLEFFRVHLGEDVAHAERTMRIVVQYARTDEEQREVKDAIRRWVAAADAAGVATGQRRRLPDDIVKSLRKPLSAVAA